MASVAPAAEPKRWAAPAAEPKRWAAPAKANNTFCPLAKLPKASRAVRVTVVWATPSATNALGLATSVDSIAATAPAVHSTSTVLAEDAVSAVRLARRAWVERACSTATPLPSVAMGEAAKVSYMPPERLTAAPGTRLAKASRITAVTWVRLMPSATSWPGEAVTALRAALGEPATKWATALSTALGALALNGRSPASVLVAVVVAWPRALLVAVVAANVAAKLAAAKVMGCSGTGLPNASRSVTANDAGLRLSATTELGLMMKLEAIGGAGVKAERHVENEVAHLGRGVDPVRPRAA